MVARTQTELLEDFLRDNGPFKEREVLAANLRVVLEMTSGNRTIAAKMLGICRDTMWRRVKWLHRTRRTT